jgi:hypothetical protein
MLVLLSTSSVNCVDLERFSVVSRFNFAYQIGKHVFLPYAGQFLLFKEQGFKFVNISTLGGNWSNNTTTSTNKRILQNCTS